MPLQINQHHYKILLLSTSGRNALLFRPSLCLLQLSTRCRESAGPSLREWPHEVTCVLNRILSMPSPKILAYRPKGRCYCFSSRTTSVLNIPSQMVPQDSKLQGTLTPPLGRL